jgi:hypothetical protein
MVNCDLLGSLVAYDPVARLFRNKPYHVMLDPRSSPKWLTAIRSYLLLQGIPLLNRDGLQSPRKSSIRRVLSTKNPGKKVQGG